MAAAAADIPISSTIELPNYTIGSMIRYYPLETKDEHYTVLQLNTGEVLQLKSPNHLVRKQLKFASFAAWYETLPGSPDPKLFKVTPGKGSPFRALNITHFESLPDSNKDSRLGDIYKWNRDIINIMSELRPDLLHNTAFVETYNVLTKLLKKYEANLMILYYCYDKYNPEYLLKFAPGPNNLGRYSYWFKDMSLTWFDNYDDDSYWYRSLRESIPVLSAAEKFTAKSQITAAFKACVDTIKSELYPILLTKYKNRQAKHYLGIYTRRLKANERAMEKLEAKHKKLEDMASYYALEIMSTEKILEEATATATSITSTSAS